MERGSAGNKAAGMEDWKVRDGEKKERVRLRENVGPQGRTRVSEGEMGEGVTGQLEAMWSETNQGRGGG